jgi:hypothetical protein
MMATPEEIAAAQAEMERAADALIETANATYPVLTGEPIAKTFKTIVDAVQVSVLNAATKGQTGGDDSGDGTPDTTS